MRRVATILGGLVAIAAVGGVFTCRWVEARRELSEAEFRRAVERSLQPGATESEVIAFLKEFATRDRADSADVHVGEVHRADWKYWGCLPEPCAPMHFGASAGSRIVSVSILNEFLFDIACSGEWNLYFFVIEDGRGYTDLYHYSRLDGCL